MSGAGPTFDVAVVGGGAIGLAAAWHATVAGLSVVLLDADSPFHERGSSGGAERQWRIQYSEEPLARLVLAAIPAWQRLERAIDRPLVHRTGSLWFGDVDQDSNEGQIRAAVGTLDRLALRYEWLDAKEIENRFGIHHLPDDYEGFYQPDGGVIDVRGTLWSLYTLAVAGGAQLRFGEPVLQVRPGKAGVDVVTSSGAVRAESAIVAAGAGTPPLLRPLGVHLGTRLFEMPSAYFRLRDPAVDYPTWFAFEPSTGSDASYYYGFGRNPWGARDVVRIAPDSEAYPRVDPSHATGVPREEEMRLLAEWVRNHLPGVDPTPLEASTCLVTLTDDHRRAFHLGVLPGTPHVVYCAAGWIFKYVPLLGEVCVALARHGAAPDVVADLLPLP